MRYQPNSEKSRFFTYAEQPLDRGDRGNEADDESDPENAEVAGERRALDQLEPGGGEHRRYREDEGELDDRPLGHTEQRPADDRRGGARDAGDHGDRLEEADQERFSIRDLLEVDVPVVFLPEALEHDEQRHLR